MCPWNCSGPLRPTYAQYFICLGSKKKLLNTLGFIVLSARRQFLGSRIHISSGLHSIKCACALRRKLRNHQQQKFKTNIKNSKKPYSRECCAMFLQCTTQKPTHFSLSNDMQQPQIHKKSPKVPLWSSRFHMRCFINMLCYSICCIFVAYSTFML